MRAALLDAKESFLSLLPDETRRLVDQTYLQVLALTEENCDLVEQGISLTGTVDSFVLRTTFRYNIRIYATKSVYPLISGRIDEDTIETQAKIHVPAIVNAARCSDAIVNVYNAERILDCLSGLLSNPSAATAQSRMSDREIQTMLALKQLVSRQDQTVYS